MNRLIATAIAVVTLGGCYADGGYLYGGSGGLAVSSAPPALLYEDPLNCGGGVYIPGSWDWYGNNWRWRGGQCMPYRSGYVYVQPYYNGGRYYGPYWGPRSSYRGYGAPVTGPGYTVRPAPVYGGGGYAPGPAPVYRGSPAPVYPTPNAAPAPLYRGPAAGPAPAPGSVYVPPPGGRR